MNTEELSPRRTDITVEITQEALRLARDVYNRSREETQPLEDNSTFTAGHLLQVEVSGFPHLLLRVDHDIILGRSDNHSEYRPEIDLSPYGGQRLGISRRHAILRQTGNQLYLADLDSRNGTTINDQRLPANAFHALRTHDVITLGTLRLRVKFIQAPND